MGFQVRSPPYWLLLNINSCVNNKLSILSMYIYLFRIAAATSWNRQWIIWKGMKGRIVCFISLSNNSHSFIFYQIPVMAGFSTVEYAGNWSDQSSFCFFSVTEKTWQREREDRASVFWRCTLHWHKNRANTNSPHVKTSPLPTCWHCGAHTQHLPSAQHEHRGTRTYC